MSDLMADAKQYLATHFKQDMSDLPEDSVRGCIDQLFTGGWVAYQQDYFRFHQTQKAVVEAMSPIKQKAFVEHITGKRLREYDEIVSLDKADTLVKVVIKRRTVNYGTRRDTVTAERVELWIFTRDSRDLTWGKPQFIEVETVAQAEHVKFGSVNTPERHESQMEQVETCYRPGTERTPMRGWVSRAEVSWAKAHEGETFQRPTKK